MDRETRVAKNETWYGSVSRNLMMMEKKEDRGETKVFELKVSREVLKELIIEHASSLFKREYKIDAESLKITGSFKEGIVCSFSVQEDQVDKEETESLKLSIKTVDEWVG